MSDQHRILDTKVALADAKHRDDFCCIKQLAKRLANEQSICAVRLSNEARGILFYTCQDELNIDFAALEKKDVHTVNSLEIALKALNSMLDEGGCKDFGYENYYHESEVHLLWHLLNQLRKTDNANQR